MAAFVRCPKGHWYRPAASGEPTACPHCKAQSQLQSGRQVSEDEILAILGPPPPKADPSAPMPEEPTWEEPVAAEHHHGHALQRRKKVCPACFYETSVSFTHCPRCGGPLEIAVIEVY